MDNGEGCGLFWGYGHFSYSMAGSIPTCIWAAPIGPSGLVKVPRAEVIARWLRTLSALAEDLDSDPSTHTVSYN